MGAWTGRGCDESSEMVAAVAEVMGVRVGVVTILVPWWWVVAAATGKTL